MNKQKIVVSVSGASGAIYAKVLFEKLIELNNQIESVGVIMSDNAKYIWETELNNKDYQNLPFTFYEKMDFMAPFASGSCDYTTMIICPCSMGMLGRIAHGMSNDLSSRAADVMLKERRRLIIMPRETPLSLVHINNMKIITESGGIICPASPSFYSNPQSFEALVATVIDRILTLSGLNLNMYRWGE